MIDKDEAIRLLRKEVANKGEDYVYEKPTDLPNTANCVYMHNNAPSCIVGHALFDAGADMTVFSNEYINGMDIMSPEFGTMANKDARIVFGGAQQAQDSGQSWGDALHEAEKQYRELGGTE